MRIDIAAHLGRWPFRPFEPATAAGLLHRLDETGIDLAVVSNLHGLFYQNPAAANDELAGWVRGAGAGRDRLVPFGVVNPTYPGWREEAERVVRRLGFRGLRLYPQYHDYTPLHPALGECLRWAEDAGVPVTFSLRMIDARGRSWLDSRVVEAETEQLRLEHVATAIEPFPGLKVIVLQSIFEQLGAEAERTLTKGERLFDTTRATTCGVAGPNSYDLAASAAKLGEARFAFGSMSPFTDPVSPILRLAAGATSEAVWGENARRFLQR